MASIDMFKKLSLITVFGALLLCSPVRAVNATGFVADMQAQTQAAAGQNGAGFGAAQDPRTIAARIVKIFLSIIGVLLLVYIIYGGALIFTSAGSEDKVNEGKAVIRRAIIGLIIILSAYSITILVSQIVQGDAGPCADGNCTIIEPDRTKFNSDAYHDNNVNPFTPYDCKYLPDGTCDLGN